MNPARSRPVLSGAAAAVPLTLVLLGPIMTAGCSSGIPPLDTPTASPASAASTASTTSTATPPTPTASASFDIVSSRTITPAGIGNLTVGLSLADGIARRMVVPDPPLACGDVDTDALLHAFPDVHTDWTPSGLRALLVSNTEYATEAGVRVGDKVATLKRAYGAELKLVPRDLDHFANLGSPAGPLGTRFGDTLPVVRNGDAFLLFPIYAGMVDHIEIGRLDASSKYVPYVGQC